MAAAAAKPPAPLPQGSAQQLQPLEPPVQQALATMESDIVNGDLVAPPSQLQLAHMIGDAPEHARGIQGLYHSSGHDTLLFALFAFTDAYDEWLRAPDANPDVRRVLIERIVNPLRRNGLVGAKRIVALRLAICRATELTARELVSENSPDQFLVTLCKLLSVPPLLKLTYAAPQPEAEGQAAAAEAAAKEQVFSVKVPFDEELNLWMLSSSIAREICTRRAKLATPPKTLVVRVERAEGPFHQVNPLFVPAYLDLHNCLAGVRRDCFFCGEKNAVFECADCVQHDVANIQHYVAKPLEDCQWCTECDIKIHQHQERLTHERIRFTNTPADLKEMPEGQLVYELQAVFSKDEMGFQVHTLVSREKGREKWVRMHPADSVREDEQHGGFNVPTVHTIADFEKLFDYDSAKERAMQPLDEILKHVRDVLYDSQVFIYRHAPGIPPQTVGTGSGDQRSGPESLRSGPKSLNRKN